MKDSTLYKVKTIAAFFGLLLLINLIFIGCSLHYKSSIVIHAKPQRPSFIQVFYPKNGALSEKNSERYWYDGISARNIVFTVPQDTPDYIRIDPADEAMDIVIEKIEIEHLFSSEILTPENIIDQIKPQYMIEKPQLTPAGVLIHSTGIDPQFILKIDKSSFAPPFLKMSLLSFGISFLIFLCASKIFSEKLRKFATLTLFPLAFSLVLAAIFYPGFMTYDSLHALRGARNGVTESTWPPMVSYVWRAVDMVSTNPSAMHFSQIAVLLLSITAIVFYFTRKKSLAAGFLLIYLCIPVVLGTIAVIWKDVLMSAFLLSGFTVTLAMKTTENRIKLMALAMLAALLIFIGACSRHNAITGAVPFLLYLAWIICNRISENRKNLIMRASLLGVILIGSTYFAKIALDKYSIPELRPLAGTSVFIPVVHAMDIAGASICAKSNLFGDSAPNLTLADIEVGYDPRHTNQSMELLKKISFQDGLKGPWRDVAIKHPLCFFSNKILLSKYLLGANEGEQFLITAPQVDDNEYGYVLLKSSIREQVISYIIEASYRTFFRPWLLYLASLAALLILIWKNKLTIELSVLYLSATFYLGGIVMFGNAADARLLFYTTTLLTILTFISMTTVAKDSFFNGKRVGSA